MAGFQLVAAFVAAVTAPTLSPSAPRQGEAIVIRLPGEAQAVRAWFEGDEVPMAAVKSGWQGLFALDLAARPGAREVTGVTVAGGKTAPWSVPFSVEKADFPVQKLTLADDSKVNLSKKDLERVGRESNEIHALWKRRSARQWSGSFAHPLETKPVGGRFGSLRIINNQPRNAHSGADYGVAKGTPVHAANAGTVVLATEHFFAGNSIYIDHGDGFVSMYFHLDEILVKVGQTVKKGDIIGKVGATGRASGPHLHFGVNYRGARVNPSSLLERELE